MRGLGVDMDITFSDLRRKEVINIADGSRLGRPVDIVFSARTGKVCGIVVPGEANIRLFRPCEDLFVPWQNILRIGEDVVLIEFFGSCSRNKCKPYAIPAPERRAAECRNEDFAGFKHAEPTDI